MQAGLALLYLFCWCFFCWWWSVFRFFSRLFSKKMVHLINLCNYRLT